MQLLVAQIVYIHDEILKSSGGLNGVRDEGLLASIVNRPDTYVFGIERYKSKYTKAAVILEAIALFHPFNDGNKRTAMASAGFYLFLHKILFTMTNEEYETFMLRVVQEKLAIREIAKWLKQHSKIIDDQEA